MSYGARVEVLAFQSTLPLRGATVIFSPVDSANLISIHAPLTGSDMPDEKCVP